MKSLGFWWYLGLVFTIAQNDQCEPAIFEAACKKGEDFIVFLFLFSVAVFVFFFFLLFCSFPPAPT